MVLDCGADFSQESVGERWYRADTLIHDDFFDSMQWKKDCGWLNAALFSIGDVVHPIPKGIEIDPPYRHAGGGDIQEAPKEPFFRPLEIDDNDGIQLHPPT